MMTSLLEPAACVLLSGLLGACGGISASKGGATPDASVGRADDSSALLPEAGAITDAVGDGTSTGSALRFEGRAAYVSLPAGGGP